MNGLSALVFLVIGIPAGKDREGKTDDLTTFGLTTAGNRFGEGHHFDDLSFHSI